MKSEKIVTYYESCTYGSLFTHNEIDISKLTGRYKFDNDGTMSIEIKRDLSLLQKVFNHNKTRWIEDDHIKVYIDEIFDCNG